jgi:hypothetical protein
MPAAQGAVVTAAIDKLANDIQSMPDEERQLLIGRRRIDALEALCGSSGGSEGIGLRSSFTSRPRRSTTATRLAQRNTAACCTSTRSAGCCATPASKASPSLLTGPSSTSAARRASRQRGCFGSSGTAIAAAPSLGAAIGASCRPTTSDGGHGAAEPTSTTWLWCARSIIGSSTSTGGTSSERRPAPFAGFGPAASGTAPDRMRRRTRTSPEPSGRRRGCTISSS